MMPSVPSDADEQILHRIAGDVLHAFVAEPHDLAVGEHDLEAHHVVAGDAVLQAAQAAGVLRDVAADGADLHRARDRADRTARAAPAASSMRCVMAPAWARSVRFRGSTSRIASICARQSTTQPGVGTLPPLSPVPEPRDNRDAHGPPATSNASRDLVGGVWKHHRVRPLLECGGTRRSCTESDLQRASGHCEPTIETSASTMGADKDRIAAGRLDELTRWAPRSAMVLCRIRVAASGSCRSAKLLQRPDEVRLSTDFRNSVGRCSPVGEPSAIPDESVRNDDRHPESPSNLCRRPGSPGHGRHRCRGQRRPPPSAPNRPRSCGSSLLGWALDLLEEHLIHRFVFHRLLPQRQFLFDPLYRLHYGHHDQVRSRDLLFTPLWFSIPVTAAHDRRTLPLVPAPGRRADRRPWRQRLRLTCCSSGCI